MICSRLPIKSLEVKGYPGSSRFVGASPSNRFDSLIEPNVPNMETGTSP